MACRPAKQGDYKIGTLLTDRNDPYVDLGQGGDSSDGRKTIYSNSNTPNGDKGVYHFAVYNKAAKVITLQNNNNKENRYYYFSLNFLTDNQPTHQAFQSDVYYLFHNDACNIDLSAKGAPHDVYSQELTIRKKQP